MRLFLMAAVFIAAANPSMACQLYIPGSYVPTVGDFIADAKVAFVGMVIGLRRPNGEVVSQAVSCEVGDDLTRETCRQRDNQIVTGILSVEQPIHGIDGERLFEMRRGEGDGACDHSLEIGKTYLVTDKQATELSSAPSSQKLAVWRALEMR